MPPTLRDRAWFVVAIAVGAVLLAAGIWYVLALAPIVDPGLIILVTFGFLVAGAIGARTYLLHHPSLDPDRPSTAVLVAMIDELARRTGAPIPRVALDDSRLGRAVANVGAVEMGPRSESILVTEQLVADLEAGRFDPASLRGVILHELGHLALDHSYLRLWTSVGERLIRLGAAVAIIDLVLDPGARRALAAMPELAVAIALGPLVVSSVLGVLQRAQETQADAFAVRHAAGRELIAFLHWMSIDLAPLLRLDRSGVPRDREQRRELRLGIERLVAEAEAVDDEERADFMRQALARLDERDLEDRAGIGDLERAAIVGRRLVRMLALAWLGVLPWNRSHPPVEERLERIAAELGVTASGEAAPGAPAPGS
ncbi:MAG TPA: M48 family metalloprotease [Candidatus Limnocylindrales bacterium]